MAAEKWLLLVVDGTAAMGPYWTTILSDYLEKIVRYFCGQAVGQEPSATNVQLGLITYKARGIHSDYLVQPSSWTSDADRFLEWLSGLQFNGGGHSEAAIAEGLSDALVMFPKLPNGIQNQQNVIGQRHCILVSASDPYPLPVPVQLPKTGNYESFGVQTEWRVVGVESVAETFPQFFISLSLMSPKKLPKLGKIYDLANCNTKGPDPSFYNVKNPYFLLLLSENFKEARDALSQYETASKSPEAMDKNLFFPYEDLEMSLSEHLFTFPEEEPVLLQVVLNEHIPADTLNAIKQIESSGETQNALSEYPFVSPPSGNRERTESQNESNPGKVRESQRRHESLLSRGKIHQESMLFPSLEVEETLFVNLQSAQNRPKNSNTTLIVRSSQNNVNHFAPANSQISTNSLNSKTTQPPRIQTSTPTFSPDSTIVIPEAKSDSAMLHTPKVPQISGIVSIPQHFLSLKRPESIDHLRTIVNRGYSSQGCAERDAVSNSRSLEGNSECNEKYVKAWEGAMCAKLQEQLILIGRVKAYRRASAPETLTADWPQRLMMDGVTAKHYLSKIPQTGDTHLLMIEALNNHEIYQRLKKRDLCAKIKLPSQTLILTPTEQECRFMGRLSPEDFPPREPRLASQEHHLKQSQHHPTLDQAAADPMQKDNSK